MSEQNFPDNVLYELDNLDVLRGMNSETVDLIATDPPFNKKRNRSGSAGQYEDAWRWTDHPTMQGKQPDQWLWQPVHREWLDEIKDANSALFDVIEATRQTQDDDTAAFLCFLSVRLLEMHRVLKPTGSIYLHCDDAANAYIRMCMDAVFGAKNFRNEVIWRRAVSHNDPKRYGRIVDHILYYSRGKEFVWNGKDIFIPKTDQEIARRYTKCDERGQYAADNITGESASDGESGKPWHGYDVASRGRHWSPPKTGDYAKFVASHFIPDYGTIEGVHDRLDALDKAGLIYHPPNGFWPGLKRYADADLGNAPQNLILEPVGFTNFNKGDEWTGSPDQKPLALYERIITVSSNEGDLVLDPFAGCATTIIAARNLKRRWIGVDRRKDARFHVVCRMMGIKQSDADEIRTRPHLAKWLDEQLAKYDAHYRTEPPKRTDEGESAAPYLGPVYSTKRRTIFTHREMHAILMKQFDARCWGCMFDGSIYGERGGLYLELDHVNPKTAGGHDDLDNRALLCSPCNREKSDRQTLSALRNKTMGRSKARKHPIDLKQASTWCRNRLMDEIKANPQLAI